MKKVKCRVAAGAPQGGDIPYGHDVTVRYGRGASEGELQ